MRDHCTQKAASEILEIAKYNFRNVPNRQYLRIGPQLLTFCEWLVHSFDSDRLPFLTEKRGTARVTVNNDKRMSETQCEL